MSGAYRDTGAAIERAEALERDVEEPKAEVARLRTAPAERKNAEPQRLPPNVQRLENDLVDARAENELLRSALAKLEGRLGHAPDPDDVEQDRAALLRDLRDVRRELADVRSELDNAHRAIEMREEEIDRLRARLERDATADNRDAVIERLGEEREELARELKAARDGYEAEPPASRDPKTFEERVLAILNRLVKERAVTLGRERRARSSCA